MKTTRILGAISASFLSIAFLLALAPAARAQTFPDLTYNVTLNLGKLANNPNGPFSLDLQLVQGSGHVTNTVTLSNFVFTGGSATGVAFSTGNVTGTVGSSLVLSTSGNPGDSEIAEALSSGVTQVTFHVDQTPYTDLTGSGTPIPDQFNVAMLDTSLNNVPTSDPSGGNALISSDLGTNSTAATVHQYSLVPEPGSMSMFLLGAGGLLALLGFRRRSA